MGNVFTSRPITIDEAEDALAQEICELSRLSSRLRDSLEESGDVIHTRMADEIEERLVTLEVEIDHQIATADVPMPPIVDKKHKPSKPTPTEELVDNANAMSNKLNDIQAAAYMKDKKINQLTE